MWHDIFGTVLNGKGYIASAGWGEYSQPLDKDIINSLEFWGAYDNGKLKGVIATNENRKHVCCFFVKAKYHRQGIGRKLWEHILINNQNSIITVNSSPYAVPVYHKLGFVDTDTEQLTDGIRYTPMKFER